MLTARDIMDVSLWQKLYIHVSNLSDCELEFFKNMINARTATPPSVIDTVDDVNLKIAL